LFHYTSNLSRVLYSPSEAELWNESQASFLKETIEEDADRVEIVDELNVLLCGPHA